MRCYHQIVRTFLAALVAIQLLALASRAAPESSPSPPVKSGILSTSSTASGLASNPELTGTNSAYIDQFVNIVKDGVKDWGTHFISIIITIVGFWALNHWKGWLPLRSKIDGLLAGQKEAKIELDELKKNSDNLEEQLNTLRLKLDGKNAFRLRSLQIRYHRILILGLGASGKTTLIENLFHFPKKESDEDAELHVFSEEEYRGSVSLKTQDSLKPENNKRKKAETEDLQLWRVAHEVSNDDKGYLYRYDIYDYRGQNTSQIVSLLGANRGGELDAKPFSAVFLMVDLFKTDDYRNIEWCKRPGHEEEEPNPEDKDTEGRWDKERLRQHEGWSIPALQAILGGAPIKPKLAVFFVNKTDLLPKERPAMLSDSELREAFGRPLTHFSEFFEKTEGSKRGKNGLVVLQGSTEYGWKLRQLGQYMQRTALAYKRKT